MVITVGSRGFKEDYRKVSNLHVFDITNNFLVMLLEKVEEKSKRQSPGKRL